VCNIRGARPLPAPLSPPLVVRPVVADGGDDDVNLLERRHQALVVVDVPLRVRMHACMQGVVTY
jgi:hypothetical protein